jgi:peptidoglycan/LPS O-acetylase OafA/YrhL
MGTAKSRSALFDHVPTLDGWRALSVFGVICGHCTQNGLLADSLAAHFAIHGRNGVSVFFAISGFLICGKLLDELRATGSFSLKAFYIRRAFRILPPVVLYLSVLAVFALPGWIETKAWELGSTLFFVRNYFPISDTRVGLIGVHTSQFWSLAVEEHFYLLWPVTMLFFGTRIRGIGWAALVSAVGVFVWRALDSTHHWLLTYGVDVSSKKDTRIDGLLWGCLAAVAYPYIRESLRGTALRRRIWIPVCAALVLAGFVKHIPGTSMIMAMLFAALVTATAIAPDSPLGRFLEIPALRWFGRISYGVYIWQQFFIFAIQIPTSPLLWLQRFPYNIPLIFVAASISYYLLERPMIQLGRKLAARAGRSQERKRSERQPALLNTQVAS